MFHRLGQFIGMRIEASDDEVGKIHDIYFDERSWAVRYLVVEAGSWFAQRKVLIAPTSVSRIDLDDHIVAIDLTRQQIEAGPSGEAPLDPQLRSAVEVTGYAFRATDSAIGHLEDFMVDAQTWAIRYLIVNTRHWLSSKHVVIPPQWIKNVDWAQRTVDLDVTSAQVDASPEFDSSIERTHATNLYRHYQRHEDHVPAPLGNGMPPCPPPDPAKRQDMIRRAAYYLSQNRGPCLTHEAEDWLAAERQIDRMLTGHA